MEVNLFGLVYKKVMNMSVDKKDFFEDMAVVMESWSTAATKAVSDNTDDLIWVDNEHSFRNLQEHLSDTELECNDIYNVFSECNQGLLVSLLTIFDGGSKLSEKGRLYIVDENGNKFGEGLHDEFISYLIETGRLK